MPTASDAARYNVALIGNPNTGKSTLFGALVGIHQHVGNYPGVTVEKKVGHIEHADKKFDVIDLPGLYSLAPRSRDEMVAVDLLLGRQADEPTIDVVLCVVDASNLRRNLYLVSQVLELGLPVVLVVNMLDVAKKHGVVVDIGQLSRRLGIPVVPVQANRRKGIDNVKSALADILEAGPVVHPSPFPEAFQQETRQLAKLLTHEPRLPDYLVERLLLDSSGYLESTLLGRAAGRVEEDLRAARDRLDSAGHAIPGVETTARYDWAKRVLVDVISEPSHYATTTTDRIDRILTHRFLGTVIFIALMIIVFQAVFSGGEFLMGFIETATGSIGEWIETRMAEGPLRSLLVDGVIGGVGGVLTFLPQILILFMFIAVLEDCGYMARAAYLMDKMMVRVGLSGKSFIPMLSSFACAIPGIMAARVIENERDRLTTILVAPLLTCSARLPVYTLLIAAFIPPQAIVATHFHLFGTPREISLTLQGLTLLGLYLLGIITAVVVALILKRTILRGQTPPFLMELPSYKWPSPRTIVYRVTQRGWLFVRCAGTLILMVSILVWAALYYPHNAEVVEAPFRAEREATIGQMEELAPDDPHRAALQESLLRIDCEIAGAYQRQSILGQAGRFVEPFVEPLGWDWRIGCSVIASFPAREIVVATLGVMYNQGDDVDPESNNEANGLKAKLHSATWDGSDPPRKVFTLPVALSILVFFALCAQCAATLAVIRRETNSWRWPVFTFTYMTALAYVGALLTYQIGTWLAA